MQKLEWGAYQNDQRRQGQFEMLNFYRCSYNLQTVIGILFFSLVLADYSLLLAEKKSKREKSKIAEITFLKFILPVLAIGFGLFIVFILSIGFGLLKKILKLKESYKTPSKS